MKQLLLSLKTFLILTNTSFGQQSYDKIILSESLFNKQTDQYDFDVVTGNIVHNIKKENIQDINDIITIDNDCINFRISYGCGCGTNEKELITNGQLHQDNQGQKYYEIKLHFTNHNKGCKKLCHDELSFDISKFKNQQTDTYIKFVGFDQLIKYK